MNVEGAVESRQAMPAPPAISELRPGRRALRVRWDDGRMSEYHYVWLRDNCGCPRCRHPQTLERIFDPASVPEGLRPAAVTLDADGVLLIGWPDHPEASRYEPAWLRAHCYSEAGRSERTPRPHTWGAELAGAMPTFDHCEVLTQDGVLRAWVAALRDTGVALVRGGPPREGALLDVARRIGRLRETNFGMVFDVVSKPDPNNNAFTALALPLHTDLPNWEFPPGYQFLYCIANAARGGDTVLVDGFRVAEVLAERDPRAFQVLSRTPVSFRFHDREVDIRQRAPVIGLDADGALHEIRYNAGLLGPLDVPASRVEAVFRALRRFTSITAEPALRVTLRLEPGDLLVFHNRRVMHARTAFDPDSGHRHLQGCYVDVDDVLSRLRMLSPDAGA